MKCNQAFLGLGSNLGDSRALICAALSEIRRCAQLELLQISGLYQTSPISLLPQPDFLNCVCEIRTNLEPEQLLDQLERIERRLGKVPKPKEAPRPIDIDTLFYGNRRLSTPRLELPHPRWNERLFVLVPLAELLESGPLLEAVQGCIRELHGTQTLSKCRKPVALELSPRPS